MKLGFPSFPYKKRVVTPIFVNQSMFANYPFMTSKNEMESNNLGENIAIFKPQRFALNLK